MLFILSSLSCLTVLLCYVCRRWFTCVQYLCFLPTLGSRKLSWTSFVRFVEWTWMLCLLKIQCNCGLRFENLHSAQLLSYQHPLPIQIKLLQTETPAAPWAHQLLLEWSTAIWKKWKARRWPQMTHVRMKIKTKEVEAFTDHINTVHHNTKFLASTLKCTDTDQYIWLPLSSMTQAGVIQTPNHRAHTVPLMEESLKRCGYPRQAFFWNPQKGTRANQRKMKHRSNATALT